MAVREKERRFSPKPAPPPQIGIAQLKKSRYINVNSL
jgi:hypothetical protein